MPSDFLLQEAGDHILLEDASGAVILESSTPTPPAPVPVGPGGKVELRYGRSPIVINVP
jgi:hypothetical protein